MTIQKKPTQHAPDLHNDPSGGERIVTFLKDNWYYILAVMIVLGVLSFWQ